MSNSGLCLPAALLVSFWCVNGLAAADLASSLPKDTDLVLSLNVRQVLESPAVKNHAADLLRTTLSHNKDLEEAIKTLGLDPLADFNRVSLGVSLEDINAPRAFVLIDGKFDPARIAALMDGLIKKDPTKFAAHKSASNPIYSIRISSQNVYATVLDKNSIALGTVKESVANAANTTPRKPEIRKELADLLPNADPKASLSIVGHVKGRLGAIPLPDADLKRMIEQVETITGEVRIDKDLQAVLTLTTSSAKVAKEVQSLAESAISLYRLQLKLALSDQPELRPLVDLASSVKAIQKDKQVVITGNLAGAAIEKLLKPDKK